MSRRRIPGRISLGTTEQEDPMTGLMNGGQMTTASAPQNHCLPLSMRLLQYVPGMHCPPGCLCRDTTSTSDAEKKKEEETDSDLNDFLAAAAFSAPPSDDDWDNNNDSTALYCRPVTSNHQSYSRDANEDMDDDSVPVPAATAAAVHDYYNLPSLRLQYTATSPLVVAPMLLHSPSNHHVAMPASRLAARMLYDYQTICRYYGVVPNAGALVALRFSLPCLRLTGIFADLDVLALCELLLHHVNGPLAYIHRLDFGLAAARRDLGRLLRHAGKPLGMSSHGALALSKVLQSSRHVQEINLQRNVIGSYGASAVFIACASNPTIRRLNLRRCRVGERGALAFAEWIAPSMKCALVEIDLSANFIGFRGSLAIERSLAARAQQLELPYIHVNIEGNLVLQEIMNGVTHGLGVLMAFAGSWLLYQAVYDKPSRHFVSCMVYSMALIVLYISSTLYHSFFILQHTKYIFEVLDKCAIYILIAGSYTPFLQIVLWNDALYSVYLLTFIWVCGFLGICVEAFFPTYRYKQFFSLAMYLGMGWSALICLPEVARKLPEGCTNLMVLGGVGYTAGVPFFVRNNNLDHAIWHLFVLAGSLCHWGGIYFYVTDYREKRELT